jgi:TolB-like protein
MFAVFIYSDVEMKKTMAILDFQPKGTDKNSASIISDLFRDSLVSVQKFIVVDRSSMETILKEQNLQQALGCSSAECAVNVGKVLGVNSIIIGTLGKLGNTYIISARMVNIENSKIEWSNSIKVMDFSQIDDVVKGLVNDLLKTLLPDETTTVKATIETSKGRGTEKISSNRYSKYSMDPITASTLAAKVNVNKTIWFTSGCLLGVLGVGLAYLVEPTPPSSLLIGKDADYVAIYTKNYKRAGKRIQTKQATYGCLSWLIISAIIYGTSASAGY